MFIFNVKDDIRIEIMEALLNNAILSKEAFTALAALFDSIDGANTDAWEAYRKAVGGVEK